jgi:hypothetical protein
MVGPFPGFEQLVGSGPDGLVFFVGSIFFTSAAALQWLQAIKAHAGRLDWWAGAVQFVGTLFFNVSTFQALQSGLDTGDYDRLVWRPDARGSICFLVSGYLAYLAVGGHTVLPRERPLEWKIAAVNFVGCAAFGISAVASFWVPSQGSVLALAASNFFTSLGGLCFLVGAVLLLPAAKASP